LASYAEVMFPMNLDS